MKDIFNATWKLDSGESAKKIRLKLGVDKSTFGNWKEQKWTRTMVTEGELVMATGKVIRAVERFKAELFTLLDKEGIIANKIYNCDESGLNFKLLPPKTLASKREASAIGYKKSKERVTVYSLQ